MSFTPCPRCIGGQIIYSQCLQCGHEIEVIQRPVKQTQITRQDHTKIDQVQKEIKELHAMLRIIDRHIAVYKLRKRQHLVKKQYEQRELVVAKIVLLETDL